MTRQARKRISFRTMSHAFRLPNSASRTYQTAEVATDAAATHQTRATGFAIKHNGLMAAIAARYRTSTAADAQLMVELRINDGVAIKRVGIQEQRQRLADECLQRR